MYYGTIGEDADEFFISYQERLYNLSLLEACWVDYPTLQLSDIDK